MFARSRRSSEPGRLPQGAEAALWSIVEVIPDPRNHLALTRDPTCEIRLSADQIEAAAAAPVPAAAASASGAEPIVEPTSRSMGQVHDLTDRALAAPTEEELIRALFAESA